LDLVGTTIARLRRWGRSDERRRAAISKNAFQPRTPVSGINAKYAKMAERRAPSRPVSKQSPPTSRAGARRSCAWKNQPDQTGASASDERLANAKRLDVAPTELNFVWIWWVQQLRAYGAGDAVTSGAALQFPKTHFNRERR
jgi:hypothetical protein